MTSPTNTPELDPGTGPAENDDRPRLDYDTLAVADLRHRVDELLEQRMEAGYLEPLTGRGVLLEHALGVLTSKRRAEAEAADYRLRLERAERVAAPCADAADNALRAAAQLDTINRAVADRLQRTGETE